MTLRAESAPLPDGDLPFGPRLLHAAIWVAIALPALYQITLLVLAIAGRIGYPYDLEWMEGGMLEHAQRIRDGAGIYVPPSVDFIPYLYTPFYPSLLALLGGAFGVSYTLGRMISVLSLIGIAIVAATQIASARHQHPRLGPPWAGVGLALGLFCAYYPITSGWYDIARADTLFLVLVTAAIAGLPRWARSGSGRAGHARIAAGGAVMALAFFTKQTGILYVGFGGLIVLVVAWRRLPVYVATVAVVGLGGTWLLQQTTDGWFWVYASKIHRAHDFSWHRFWTSFGNILWRCELPQMAKMPAIGGPITLMVVLALATVVVTWRRRRVVPPQVQPLLLWSAAFALSIVVGAIGYGTEFAHFNAYMPAFLHGALAAGAALPAVYACVRVIWGVERARCELVATGAAVIVALPLALTCLVASWSPSRFTPTAGDRAAGDKLIARIRAIDGDVWLPSHPWYAELAGKSTVHAHRMSIKDVTWRQNRKVERLDEAFDRHQFSAIVLDTRDLQLDLPVFNLRYHPALRLPSDERPRVFTGAGAMHSFGGLNTPDTIWVPAVPSTPPAGARVVFDFEAPAWTGWARSGAAWGNGPVAAALPGQDLVLGTTGARFATSMNGGDAAIGRVTSPPFALDGNRLSMKLGGRADAARLHVELRVGTANIATVAVPVPGGDALREVSLDLATHRGQDATLVLVDESRTGHLDVDDVWIWQ